MTPLQDIFGPQGQITWWQECARAAVVFRRASAVIAVSYRRR